MEENNPHEYDDEKFLAGSLKMQEAINLLWEAGATEEQIDTEVENAKENTV